MDETIVVSNTSRLVGKEPSCDSRVSVTAVLCLVTARVVPVFLRHTNASAVMSRYGELQGLNKKETADKYGTDMVTKWRRSYDIPPPNGESLAMCADRAVAYFKENVEPQLKAGKNVLIAAHGNSLRAIIMYLDSLTSQEVGGGSDTPCC